KNRSPMHARPSKSSPPSAAPPKTQSPPFVSKRNLLPWPQKSSPPPHRRYPRIKLSPLPPTKSPRNQKASINKSPPRPNPSQNPPPNRPTRPSSSPQAN